jgi:hypothetical protein
MNRGQELAIVRRAHAKQVMPPTGRTNPAIEAAFATVERERFLGPGPWPALRSGGYARLTQTQSTSILRPFKKERGTSRQSPAEGGCLVETGLGLSSIVSAVLDQALISDADLLASSKLRRDARQETRPLLHRTRSDSLRCESRALRFP